MFFCIAESKLDNDDFISCSNHTFYNYPRKQSYYRKSGGLGFFVRHTLAKYVDMTDSSSEYIAWIKISKTAHKLDKDILIGTVYVPPQQSRLFNEDESELFEHEISSACSKDYHVLLTGDFNAQTSDCSTAGILSKEIQPLKFKWQRFIFLFLHYSFNCIISRIILQKTARKNSS